jgi:hypothetical protein
LWALSAGKLVLQLTPQLGIPDSEPLTTAPLPPVLSAARQR